MKATTAAVVAAPSIGPVIVTAFGVNIPVLALALSVLSLMVTRWVSPRPLRKLSRAKERALTLLLIIILFLIVTGEMPLLGGDQPLGVGMAVVWGVGLGYSGLMIIELMGARVESMVRVAFGLPDRVEKEDEDGKSQG